MYAEYVLPGEVHFTGVLKRITKDRAGFLFHRTIVRSRPHSQLGLYRVIEVSNSDGRGLTLNQEAIIIALILFEYREDSVWVK